MQPRMCMCTHTQVAGKSNIAVETSTFNIPKYFQFCKDFKITNVRITIPKLLYIFIISNWDEEVRKILDFFLID